MVLSLQCGGKKDVSYMRLLDAVLISSCCLSRAVKFLRCGSGGASGSIALAFSSGLLGASNNGGLSLAALVILVNKRATKTPRVLVRYLGKGVRGLVTVNDSAGKRGMTARRFVGRRFR